LFALLEDPSPPAPLTGLQPLGAKSATEGVLRGGNLELLSRLCGTPLQPKLDGAVLLIEDVSERPYRLDRAITQLHASGALEGVRGVLLGELVKCEDKDGVSATEVIVEHFGHLPLLGGAPVGHGARNRALPLGARIRLDGDTATLLDGLVC